ncbi:hypothetical protein SRB5_68190 [Streptomyces sp. RB5]|uniref:Uncharacterized protein n=1 Tax=Streptomyces smaragdinus TaxID=2585196 RepID=A0A7K0CT03_9ACTN|nr:hypothetical protein [Streptomyces smaragdinus]MQY16617.1 hypothetical protein [Streptomyces smaragdinus]
MTTKLTLWHTYGLLKDQTQQQNIPQVRSDLPPPLRSRVNIGTDTTGEKFFALLERELPPGGIPAYLAARKKNVRSFVLWADQHRDRRVATVVTERADGGGATYQVLDEHGRIIATIAVRRAFHGGLRTRWTVRRPGAEDAVGYKGRLVWWLMYWLLFPLWVFMGIAAILGGDVPRAPRRVIWRTGGRRAFEHKAGGNDLRLSEPELDHRVAAALLCLVRTDDGWFGRPWDGDKE